MRTSFKNDKKIKTQNTPNHTRSFDLSFDIHLEKLNENNFFSPCHFHKGVEIVYVEDGYMDFKIEDKDYNLKSEDCLIINSETLHSFRIDSNANYYIIQIPLSAFDTIEQSDISLVEKPAKREALVLRNKLSEMIGYYQSPACGDQAFFVSKLYELISLLITDYQDKTKEKPDSDAAEVHHKIVKAVSYIEKHFKKDISVSDAASHISVTPEYFNRQFKKLAGVTFADHLMSLRVTSFYDEFIHTNKKTADIAKKNGLTNYSTLLREFKKVYGKTPDQIRNEVPTGRKMQMELV